MERHTLSGNGDDPVVVETVLSTEGLAQQLMVAFLANHELPTQKYAKDIAGICAVMARALAREFRGY